MIKKSFTFILQSQIIHTHFHSHPFFICNLDGTVIRHSLYMRSNQNLCWMWLCGTRTHH
ncbi:hypothetical protein HanXRQr2_Chr11g0512721 [Helianthus annuus]|uniref:Uncharacterized protein n=1 Tax=Helianthus annuus TaxID=4232 RepID=A0A9K3HSH5_HELAN|nr:hypothetical protein HanXRQr2_Chr11g0512721 [Helianthus annuus]